MPNVSELQRLEEERIDLISKIRSSHSTFAKQVWLEQLRAIERQLGLVSHPYNSSMWPDGYRAEDER